MAAVRAADQMIDREVNVERIKKTLQTLTGRPHHAGSIHDLKTAEYVQQQFTLAGLEARIETYEVLLPWPEEVTVEMLTPVAYRCSMHEEALDTDFDTHTSGALPPHLAFSPDGEAIGSLVFVNRASREDFRKLDDMGVSLKGAIGIARYGGLFRGSKVKNAAAAGLAGLLLYSDPQDDGFHKGDVYPNGPWRPESAVQRGSILDIARHPGDPLTPGWAALPGADRRDLEDVDTIPGIPAAALSAKDARPLLESLRGTVVPGDWQGGLPFAYHIGGGDDVTVRISVRNDWRIRRIWNVIGTLRGMLFPNDQVIVGNHRDACVHGAVDPGSGTAVMIEAAHVLGALARDGRRPARSVVFCSWDAEEYGMFGSLEHVEHFRTSINQRATMYINVDAAVSGGKFRAKGSPELSLLLNGALDGVRDDRSDTLHSMLDAVGRTRLELPGGGSDFVGFMHRLAIPVIDIASSGPYGVYHSLYDTYAWMKKFGDPDFQHHARMARILSVLLNRAAMSTVIPIDYTLLADWVREKSLQVVGTSGLDTRKLDDAVEALRKGGEAINTARTALAEADPDPIRVAALNRAVCGIGRLLAVEGLLKDRPFYRNALVATDEKDGYGADVFPAVAEALRQGESSKAQAAIDALAAILDDMAERLVGTAATIDRVAREASTKRTSETP